MRRSLTPIVCAIALLSVAAVATGPAVGQAGSGGDSGVAEATLVVDDATVGLGSTAETAVSLSAAPDGMSGYNVTVRVADPEVATIVNASVPDGYGLAETRVVDDGAAVVLKAADTSDDVTAGAEDVPLGTVTVRGESAGETELRVEVTSVDDDDGNRVDPGIQAGSLVVDDATPTTTRTTTEAPTTTAPPSTTETPTTTETPPETTTEAPTTTQRTETSTATEGPETTTGTATTATGSPADPTATTAPTGTATDAPTATTTETATIEDPTPVPTEDGSTPGFGVVLLLAALATLAAVRGRR